MTVLFFVIILFDETRPKVLCIHTKVIIVCRALRTVEKRERLLVVYMFAVDVLFRSIMIKYHLEKRLDLTISGTQSN